MRNTNKFFIITLSILLLFLSSCGSGSSVVTTDAETEAITELNTTYWETLESVKPSEKPSLVTDNIHAEQTSENIETQENAEPQIDKEYLQKLIEEDTVAEMFRNHGTYNYEDGTYYFRSYDVYDTISITRKFTYDPEINMFNCLCSVVTDVNMGGIIYDFGSITFMWGNLEQALYYANHDFCGKSLYDILATISFEYPTFVIGDDLSIKDYTYKVTENTFSNLKNKNEIAEYAQKSSEIILQSALYAQSVIYAYTNIAMW